MCTVVQFIFPAHEAAVERIVDEAVDVAGEKLFAVFGAESFVI